MTSRLLIPTVLPLFVLVIFFALMQGKVAEAAALIPTISFDGPDYDLTDDFVPGDGDSFATTTDGGIGDSGAVDADGTNLYTTIDSFSIPATNDTISVSKSFQYQTGDEGYYIGFVASSSVSKIDAQNRISEPGLWSNIKYDTVYLASNDTVSEYFYAPLVVNQWYKVVFALVPLGGDSYDVHFQLWTISSTTGETIALQYWETEAGVDNGDLALNAEMPGAIHAFFGNDSSSLSIIDNFEVRDDQLVVPWESGDGETAETAYEITSCGELQAVGSHSDALSAYYRLEADIDCANTAWWNEGAGFLPISSASKWGYFVGEIDGNNYAVTDLSINRPSDNSGLFSDFDGQVANFGLENVDITGGSYTGGFAAILGSNAVVVDSYVVGGSITGASYTGGFVGRNTGHISQSYVEVSVQDNTLVGGFVGQNAGTIEESYATGSVEGELTVGGFVGQNESAIVNAYTHTTVSAEGEAYVGGFVGQNSGNGNIFYAYSTGEVTHSSDPETERYVGGFAGGNSGGIYSSFSVGQVSALPEVGYSYIGGFIGVNNLVDPNYIEYNNGWLTAASTVAIGEVYDDMDLFDFLGPQVEIAWNQTELDDFKDSNFGLYNISSSEIIESYAGEDFTAWDFAEEGVWGLNNVDPEENNDGWPFFRWQDLSHNFSEATESGAAGQSSSATKVGFRKKDIEPVLETVIISEDEETAALVTIESIVNKYRELFLQAKEAGIFLPQYIHELLNVSPTSLSVRDLEYGMEGEDVLALQQILINQGYAIPAGSTGFFLSQTEAALSAYQADRNIIPAVGYFGAITRAVMKAAGLPGLWW